MFLRDWPMTVGCALVRPEMSLQEMLERSSLMVTLHHCNDRPRRESMLALLYFLYTGQDRFLALPLKGGLMSAASATGSKNYFSSLWSLGSPE